MESNEGSLSTLIKNITYAILVGMIYYFGTYFWVSIFIRDEGTREKYAEWGLLPLPIAFIVNIVLMFYNSHWFGLVLNITAVHVGILLLGAIFNSFRFVISLFLRSDETLYKSTLILCILILSLTICKYT
jgi:hypothetical protein